MKYILIFMLSLIPLSALSKTYSDLESSLKSIPPSFNCNLASTEIEKKICFGEESRHLGELDFYLGKIYRIALRNAPDSSLIRQSQREWLKLRDEYYYRYDVGDAYGFECSTDSKLVECYQYGIYRLFDLIDTFPKELKDSAYSEVDELDKELIRLWGLGDRKENLVDEYFYKLQINTQLNNIGLNCTYASYEIVEESENFLVYKVNSGRSCQGMGNYWGLVLACYKENKFVETQELQLSIWGDYTDFKNEILELNPSQCNDLN